MLHLFRSLLWREIRHRYLASIGGLAWALILPLAQLAIYAFVFVHIFKARIPGADLVGFVPYLAVAFWPWNAFSESLLRASTSITENAALIGKVALPHEVLVLSAATAAFVLNIAGYIAVLVVLAFLGTAFHYVFIPVALAYIVLLFMFSLGCAYIVAATQVYIRDLGHALGPILMLWFFSTPILYSIDLVPERFHNLLALNPLLPIVQGLRHTLLFGTWSPAWTDFLVLALTPFFLWLARSYFHRLSLRFEDYL